MSITTLGAAFGAFTGGFFSDYYGRCAPAPRAAYRETPAPAHARASAHAPRRRSAIMASDLVFAMAALKRGVAMTPRQLIEGRAIMVRALAARSRRVRDAWADEPLRFHRGLLSAWRP